MSMTINGTSGLTFNDGSTQPTAANGNLGFRNRIINGAMMIDQRNAGAAVTPAGVETYTVDRFSYIGTQASKFTIQQNANSVTPPVGFTNYLGFTVASAVASPSASDQFAIYHKIEGLNCADLGFGTATASAVTLSFWVRSSLTGTFSGGLVNSAGNRSYVFNYTISSANTWEQKSVTIAGDTTGTWLTTNGIGIQLRLDLGSGSNQDGTVNTWQAADKMRTSSSVRVVSTASATFYITGVQLEKGSTATSFDYRPYGTELALCQRYYFQQTFTQTQAWAYGYQQTTNTLRMNVNSPVAMRTSPSFSTTATHSAPYAGYNGSTTVSGSATPTSISCIDYTGTNVTLQATATGIVGVSTVFGYSGSNFYSAEL